MATKYCHFSINTDHWSYTENIFKNFQVVKIADKCKICCHGIPITCVVYILNPVRCCIHTK